MKNPSSNYLTFYSGEILKYSYSYVKNNKSLLRFDNAPHHDEIQTHPHHKHVKGEIYPLKKPEIGTFIKEVLEFIKKR